VHFEDKKGLEEFYMHASRDLNIHVKHDRHETVEGERHLDVWKDRIESVGQNAHLKVAQDDAAEIGQDFSRKIGGNVILQVGASHAESAGQEIYLKAGMNVVIEAGLEITLKASGGFVTIGPSGVTIQGTMVLINSGGAAGTGTAQQPKSIKPVIGVEEPDTGSPDYNIFMPSNVADPGNATGSAPVTPGQTLDE
jgi:type VI secretion system secreted protein VgrG